MKDFQFDWQNNEVKVKTLKKCPIFNDRKGIIEYFEPEIELYLPYWRAKWLEEKKKIKIIPSSTLNFIEIDKLNYKEHSNSELQELPDNFFIDFLFLTKKSKQEQLKNKLFSNFNEILDRRLYKIFKIMTFKMDLKYFEKRFSSEEKYLYQELKLFFDKWKYKIISY